MNGVPPESYTQGAAQEAALRRTRALAWLLDESIPIPGTNFRVGLDFLIGLIPGIGDILGGLLSSAIVLQALEQGVSKATIIRMAGNVLVETIVGAVPLFGDLFDAAWKANSRNVRLLEGALVNRQSQTRADRWFVFGVIAGIMALTIGFAAAGVLMLMMIVDALS